MPSAAQPVNVQTTALGTSIRKVVVEQVVPERAIAIVRDNQQFTTEIPYKVQAGRGRIPRVGDYWYVDRSMGPWVFSSYIAKNDGDLTDFDFLNVKGDLVIAEGDVTLGEGDLTVTEGDLTVGGSAHITGDVTTDGAFLRPRFGVASTAAIEPLATVANTDAVILSVAATFKNGYAYRITYSFRTQHNGGTSPFFSYAKLRRASVSGTVIYDPGGTACITTNFMRNGGWCDVKNTSGNDHTQTIVLVGGMSGSGSATSIDVQGAANAPSSLQIEMLGLASQYVGAIEVPTA